MTTEREQIIDDLTNYMLLQKVHRVLGHAKVTFCGRWAYAPRTPYKPDGEECLRCIAVHEGLYQDSVALGRNPEPRRHSP